MSQDAGLAPQHPGGGVAAVRAVDQRPGPDEVHRWPATAGLALGVAPQAGILRRDPPQGGYVTDRRL